MATQGMVLFVQVKNVINLGKFNDGWYIATVGWSERTE